MYCVVYGITDMFHISIKLSDSLLEHKRHGFVYHRVYDPGHSEYSSHNSANVYHKFKEVFCIFVELDSDGGQLIVEEHHVVVAIGVAVVVSSQLVCVVLVPQDT